MADSMSDPRTPIDSPDQIEKDYEIGADGKLVCVATRPPNVFLRDNPRCFCLGPDTQSRSDGLVAEPTA